MAALTFLPFEAAPLSLSSECPSIPVFQYSSINYIILYILFQPVFQPPSSGSIHHFFLFFAVSPSVYFQLLQNMWLSNLYPNVDVVKHLAIWWFFRVSDFWHRCHLPGDPPWLCWLWLSPRGNPQLMIERSTSSVTLKTNQLKEACEDRKSYGWYQYCYNQYLMYDISRINTLALLKVRYRGQKPNPKFGSQIYGQIKLRAGWRYVW